MNTLRRFVLVLLLGLFGLIFSGCTNQTPQDSSIPWSRPANWEGQVPGMGQAPGSGIR